MKKLGLVAAVAVAALSVNASVSAGNVGYPPEDGILILAPNPVGPGGDFTATFIGCSIGETVNFSVEGDSDSAPSNGPAGESVRPNATGAPQATVVLTAPTTPGNFPVVASCATSGAGATGILTVVGAGAPAPGAPAPGAPAPGSPAAPGGQLPATGSDSAPTMQIAGGLVAVGAGLALVGGLRRRKLAAI